MSKYTLAHVTHEAVEKIGGIGTVLEGLITSPEYQKQVGRSILVGPCSAKIEIDPAMRLGPHGRVLYSSVDQIDELGLGVKLHPIEWAFGVQIIYGTRTYEIPGDKRTGEAEVMLIDVFSFNKDRLSRFKYRLSETFGIDCMKYENDWGFEEYTRLAEPAFYGLTALLRDEDLPCVLFAHEFMGLPAAFKAVLDGARQFRTLFHAHECSTARHIVEHHPGHDTMFYNVLDAAAREKKYVGEIFGDMSHNPRHALISRAHLCDGIIAVGDDTAREMHFLDRKFDHHEIDLVYNGVPTMDVTPTRKKRCRKMLIDYAEKLVGYQPDVLMTHVMRPVTSKGVWRDFATCDELSKRFAKTGQTGVLFILTSSGGVRRPQDIRAMEKEYGWPRHHREGFPDLVGQEVDYNRMAEQFNADHDNIQVVLVNQFGWDSGAIGERLPKGMHIGDLRTATDVEFGMATYEPFGISPLEPLCAGAVCVISNICGCAGFVREVTGDKPVDNVLVADYTQLDAEWSIDELLNMTQQDRDVVEQRVAVELADRLMDVIPTNDTQRKKMLEAGSKLAHKMGWDRVFNDHLEPMLDRVVSSPRSGD